MASETPALPGAEQVSGGEQASLEADELAVQTAPVKTAEAPAPVAAAPATPAGENPFLKTAEERAAAIPKPDRGYVDFNPVRLGGPVQSQASAPEVTSPVAAATPEIPAAQAISPLPEQPAEATPATPAATLEQPASTNPMQFTPEAAIDAAKTVSQTPPTT